MAPARDRRPGFSRRAQYSLFFTYVLAVAIAAVGAVLLAVSAFNPPLFAALRSVVAEVTTPVAAAGRALVGGIAAIPDTVATYFRVHDENARLRAAVARDRALVLRARSIAYENHRLRKIAALREGDTTVVTTARLVGSTPTSTRRFATLNAGRWQGVRPGQPVRGPHGLIGRVVETGANAARVLLIVDPESIVPVRRARDGRAALAVGRGDGLLDIRIIDPRPSDLRAGDLFVTSGTGGIFTPGVPVGTIVSRQRDSGIARPVASPAALDFAVVSHAFVAPLPPPAQAETQPETQPEPQTGSPSQSPPPQTRLQPRP